MKIYKLDGKMYQEPVKKGFDYTNAVEILSPILEDGTIISSHPKAKDLPKKGDGTFYSKYNEDLTANVDYEKSQLNEILVMEVKAAISKAIDTMRVEIDGVGYNGNEVSTTRMHKAITTLVGDETIPWKMYDNKTVVITQTELKKAMRKAGILQSKLWFCQNIEQIKSIVEVNPLWLKEYSL